MHAKKPYHCHVGVVPVQSVFSLVHLVTIKLVQQVRDHFFSFVCLVTIKIGMRTSFLPLFVW